MSKVKVRGGVDFIDISTPLSAEDYLNAYRGRMHDYWLLLRVTVTSKRFLSNCSLKPIRLCGRYRRDPCEICRRSRSGGAGPCGGQHRRALSDGPGHVDLRSDFGTGSCIVLRSCGYNRQQHADTFIIYLLWFSSQGLSPHSEWKGSSLLLESSSKPSSSHSVKD